jgi:hypothetical protein
MSEPRGPKTWTPPPDRMLRKTEPMTPEQQKAWERAKKVGVA